MISQKRQKKEHVALDDNFSPKRQKSPTSTSISSALILILRVGFFGFFDKAHCNALQTSYFHLLQLNRDIRDQLLPEIMKNVMVDCEFRNISFSNQMLINIRNLRITSRVQFFELTNDFLARFPALEWLSVQGDMRWLQEDLSANNNLLYLNIDRTLGLPRAWPGRLKSLIIRELSISKLRETDLPSSLTTLCIGNRVPLFNTSVFTVPINLQSLSCFLCKIPVEIPPSLTLADFHLCACKPHALSKVNFPVVLNELKLHFVCLPDILDFHFPAYCVELSLPKPLPSLPSFLCSLRLKTITTRDFPDLPPTLCYLHVQEFNTLLQAGMLPPKLEYLHLEKYSSYLGADVLPSTLKTLKLDNWNSEFAMTFNLPPLLETLLLGQLRRLWLVLPISLQSLRLPWCADVIFPESIPSTIIQIVVGRSSESLNMRMVALGLFRKVFKTHVEFFRPGFQCCRANFENSPRIQDLISVAEKKEWWIKQ